MELGRRRRKNEDEKEGIRDFFASKYIARAGGEKAPVFVKLDKNKVVENPSKDLAYGVRSEDILMINSKVDLNSTLQSKANMRIRQFEIWSSGKDISQSIFFESKKESSISRAFVLDVKSQTAYYRANNSVFQYVSEAADSRNITSVEFLD